MFNRLKTIFKGRVKSEAPPSSKFEPRAPASVDHEHGKPGKLEKAKKNKTAAVNPAAAKAPAKPQTPEEVCGITAKMSKDEVRTRLAQLYKRYNRATSSLDADLRAEAEEVLDAIVAVREKIFGPI